MRIENIPFKVKKIHLEKLLMNRLKQAGLPAPTIAKEGDLEAQTGSKIAIEYDIKGNSMRRAWFQGTNRDHIKQLLHLHNKVWMEHELRTYLMGFTYDDEYLEAGADDDFKVEKWAQKNPDYVNEFILTRKKKSGATSEKQTTETASK